MTAAAAMQAARRAQGFLRGMVARTAQVRVGADLVRPVLGDSVLALPAQLVEPARLAAAAHALAHWRHSPVNQPADALKPLGLALAGLIEDARVEALLLRELPGVRTFWAPFHDAIEREGLNFTRLCARLAKALFDASYRDGNAWVDKGAMLFRTRLDAAHDYAAFRSIASVLANDLGQMRVRYEEDDGALLPFRDDNAWLWTRSVDAAEPNAAQALDSPHKPPESEAPDDEAAPPAAGSRYSEWDYRMARERQDWTTIIECPAPAPALNADAGLLAEIAADRRVVAPYAPPRALLVRRRGLHAEGDLLDIDAAIAWRTGEGDGAEREPRVYRAHEPRANPSPVLVLLDLSASTAERVAALEKRAACLLGDQFERERRCWAVHGYASDGRHRVYYTRFKDFEEPFDARRRAAVLGAPGELSTRTGAALRHAAVLALRFARTARATIVLIGDGEAADIDVYDSRYLDEDAHRAAREARRRGMTVLGLSFGASAGYSAILGGGAACHRIDDDGSLPLAVAALSAHLAG
jgi:nitric oxide reductase NorD protein